MQNSLQMPAQFALVEAEEMIYLDGGSVISNVANTVKMAGRIIFWDLPVYIVSATIESIQNGIQEGKKEFMEDITNPNFHMALAMSMGVIAFADLLFMAVGNDSTQPA